MPRPKCESVVSSGNLASAAGNLRTSSHRANRSSTNSVFAANGSSMAISASAGVTFVTSSPAAFFAVAN
jgi:hypothetical protein